MTHYMYRMTPYIIAHCIVYCHIVVCRGTLWDIMVSCSRLDSVTLYGLPGGVQQPWLFWASSAPWAFWCWRWGHRVLTRRMEARVPFLGLLVKGSFKGFF